MIIKPYICRHCGHSWYPRKLNKPLRCGQCRRAYWPWHEVSYEQVEAAIVALNTSLAK